jgi:hypothetical protein
MQDVSGRRPVSVESPPLAQSTPAADPVAYVKYGYRRRSGTCRTTEPLRRAGTPRVHCVDHARDLLAGQIGVNRKADFGGGDAAGSGAIVGEVEDGVGHGGPVGNDDRVVFGGLDAKVLR